MRSNKSIALTTCLVSLPLLFGCGGGDSGNNNNNNNNNNQNNNLAATSLAGRTLHVAVTGGASPFSSSGSYVFKPSGNGNSGTYLLTGSGGVQSNIGTYTYSASGNTGNLLETEQSGTLVQNTLTFTSSDTGTIHSSSSNVGGFQDGTFFLQ
jgi:hypothetical protein